MFIERFTNGTHQTRLEVATLLQETYYFSKYGGNDEDSLNLFNRLILKLCFKSLVLEQSLARKIRRMRGSLYRLTI